MITVVNKKKKKTVTFGSLKGGDTFKHRDNDSVYYVFPLSKLKDGSFTFNSFDIVTGDLEFFDKATEVEPVNATLTVE